MPTKPFDAYAVLGIKKDAKDAQIKAAHRKIAKEKHPDVCKDGGDAMALANKAKKTLLDPIQRKKHDDDLLTWEQRNAEEKASKVIRPTSVQRRQPQQPAPRRQSPSAGINLYQMGVQAEMQQIARRQVQANEGEGARFFAVAVGLLTLNYLFNQPKPKRRKR